jgi:hypothetical protein
MELLILIGGMLWVAWLTSKLGNPKDPQDRI